VWCRWLEPRDPISRIFALGCVAVYEAAATRILTGHAKSALLSNSDFARACAGMLHGRGMLDPKGFDPPAATELSSGSIPIPVHEPQVSDLRIQGRLACSLSRYRSPARLLRQTLRRSLVFVSRTVGQTPSKEGDVLSVSVKRRLSGRLVRPLK
jgi:hypothetical protein